MTTCFKLIIFTCLFFSVKIVFSQDSQSTLFSTQDCIVMQIYPDLKGGKIVVNGKKYEQTVAHVFIPNSLNLNKTISCPLNYFQNACSIPQKWIKDDQNLNQPLNYIDSVNKVIITIKNNSEKKVNLSKRISKNLFDFFRLDINHKIENFIGFDCYAFQCLLFNVKYCPRSPYFSYLSRSPEVGECVVLTKDNHLPGSILHWALYLGEDLYLSKFGMSGVGSQALVAVMDLQGMKTLYECKKVFVAIPQKGTTWDGFKKCE